MSVFEKIRAALSETFDIPAEQITMESDVIRDLEIDSLDMVEMAMDLEDDFGIEVPDEALMAMHTVGDVVHFVEENAKIEE